MRTTDLARQRTGAVVFCVGAVATVAWGVGALLTLLDLALGATAPTYVPWLVAGAIPVTIAAAGVLLYGGMPRVTRRAGWLGAAWGVGLLFFIGGVDAMLHGANNVRLGGPSGQTEANVLVRAVVVELVLTVAIPAGIALWRRRWFPTLVAGATMVCFIGLLDTIFIVMASAPF
jgi:hypothetical protein